MSVERVVSRWDAGCSAGAFVEQLGCRPRISCVVVQVGVFSLVTAGGAVLGGGRRCSAGLPVVDAVAVEADRAGQGGVRSGGGWVGDGARLDPDASERRSHQSASASRDMALVSPRA